MTFHVQRAVLLRFSMMRRLVRPWLQHNSLLSIRSDRLFANRKLMFSRTYLQSLTGDMVERPPHRSFLVM